MALSSDGDVERHFTRLESRRQQRSLAPVVVLFLGIALQPFREAVALTREASSYIGVLAAAGLVAAYLTDADAAEPGRQRSTLARCAKWSVRLLGHAVCLRYDDAAHSVLLRLLSMVVFPLVGARDADGALFSVYLAMHFVFSWFHVGGDPTGDGWQWLVILMICDLLFWDMSESTSDQRELQALLSSTSQVVQSLLGTICDGCLLLGDDGTIAGSDQKAASLLGLAADGAGGGSSSSSAAPRMGSVLEGVLENGKLVRGLRMLRLATGGGTPEEKLQVEAYIIPFPISRKDALVLGLHLPEQLAAGRRVHLCAFRLADGGFEPQVAPKSAPPGPPSIRGMRQNPAPLKIPPREVTTRGQSDLLNPEGSTVDSGLASPRTQAASAIAGPAPAHPGIPLQSIQAVGLGVGSYTKVRVVGRGSQAQVWQVTSQDGTLYAQKEIALKGVLWQRDFPKRLRDADREVRALKGLSWASCVIVPIVDCWIQKDFEMSCIVMEWLPKSLDTVLKKLIAEKSITVPLPVASSWLARLAAGLGAIHAAGFIHRDLKPSNILLDESLQQCKITDLGVSRALHRQGPGKASGSGEDPARSGSVVSLRSEAPEEKFSMLSENMGSILSGYTVRPGTIAYTSPEARESCHYGCEADIFSLGVVLMEMMSLTTPPEPRLGEVTIGSAMMDRAKDLLANVPPGCESSVWAELRHLCIWMLKALPEDRPSAQELAKTRVLKPHIEQLVQGCPRLRVLLLQNG